MYTYFMYSLLQIISNQSLTEKKIVFKQFNQFKIFRAPTKIINRDNDIAKT